MLFWVSYMSDTFLFIRRIKRDIVINIHRSLYKLIVILVILINLLIFSTDVP
jgi:hypothetical protein